MEETGRPVEKPRILVADDQEDIVQALKMLLKAHGFEIRSASSPAAALEILHGDRFDLFLMDLNYSPGQTSVREGIELLTQAQRLEPLLPVVVMTGCGSIELAVEAMRLGAANFIQKPWDNRYLLEVVREQIARGRTRRQVERDLAVEKLEFDDAEAVQRAFLPPSLPQVEDCEMAVEWRPRRRIGGDYYDIFLLDERRIGFCVADVSGKGLPAALLMSNLQAGLRSFATASTPPAEVVSRVNRLLCTNHLTNKFVTLFYGILDLDRFELAFANAGHPALIIHRADGRRLELAETGGIVGFFPDWTYRQEVVPLETGDTLWLFTDGILEARDSSSAEFGSTRLPALLDEIKWLSLAEAKDRVWSAVLDHCGGKLEDDATLLAFRILGTTRSGLPKD
ncbi:MAG: SpoIIE family protein phosphatase [Candidatus Aminicenantes bacterium]|nr:SpoIIE family protein phosphatase [Candidatus Aminicenantes bacterium]